MIKVVVTDDHAVVRTGLHLIFREEDIQIKGEASNGDELLEILKGETFDVAVIDINMPGKDSLDLVRELRKSYPELPLIVFTMSKDEQLALRFFKNGIHAYINKEEDPIEIVNAVKASKKSEIYLTNQQKNLFASRLISNDPDSSMHKRLTDREYQILSHLASGKSKNEIAQKLNISKHTISNHRNNILKKLNLSNIAELTRYALQHQIIT
jgi:DNA-binding NarL/FixJ family response regulator